MTLPEPPNDPDYPRWASDLKWMKGGQKRGRIDRRGEEGMQNLYEGEGERYPLFSFSLFS